MKMKTLIVAMTAALSLNALSGEREVSYALEDAAFQAAMRMDADARVAKDVKRIAFVKLWLPKPGEALSLAGCDTAVMEASLGAVPCRFDFVLHDSRSEQWTLIDQVFDQAAALTGMDYEPAAVLATQVVAGTNYAFLCKGTVVYPDAQPSWYIIYIYADLEGNDQLVNIVEFDFGAGYVYGTEE